MQNIKKNALNLKAFRAIMDVLQKSPHWESDHGCPWMVTMYMCSFYDICKITMKKMERK